MRYKKPVAVTAAISLGLVFIIAGLGKLPPQTEAYMIIFGLHRALLQPTLADHIDTWLPRLEIALGLLLIAGVTARLAAGFAGALTIAFIFNNSWEIARGAGGDPCGCFGENWFLGYLTNTHSLYIDIGMLALAGIVLLWYSKNWLSIHPWFIKESKWPGKG